MRFVTVVLVLFCLFNFNFYSLAQTREKPAYIVTLDGKTVEGTISSFTEFGLYDDITFNPIDGKSHKYLPGEIKSFYVKGDNKSVVYESLNLKDFGSHFFMVEFTDKDVKYLSAIFKEKGEKEKQLLQVYIIGDTSKIIKSPLKSFFPTFKTDTWTKGGVIINQKDTLFGEVLLTSGFGQKISIKNRLNQEISNYKLKEIDGFFDEQNSFIKVLTYGRKGSQPDAKILLELLNDHPMKLYGYMQTGDYGGGMSYYIKREEFDNTLYFYTERNVTYFKEDIRVIKDWFKEYPALANAIIGKQIMDIKAVVTLFNFYMDIKKYK